MWNRCTKKHLSDNINLLRSAECDEGAGFQEVAYLICVSQLELLNFPNIVAKPQTHASNKMFIRFN